MKLPILSGLKLIKSLEKNGFKQLRTSGSHVQLKGFFKGKERLVTVPFHKEISPSVLLNIIKRQLGLTRKEFEEMRYGKKKKAGK